MVSAEPPADDTPAAHRLWTGIGEAIHAKIAPKIADAKHEAVARVLEQFEQELVPHLAPIVRNLLDNPALPPEVRDLLEATIDPEHFTQSLLVGIAIGSILSPILGAATQPLVTDIANNAWHNAQSMVLSPAEAALASLRHNPHVPDPALEATMSGLSQDRFDALVYNTGEPISIGDGLLLFRRGQMDDATLRTLVRQSRVRDEWYPYVLDLRYQPPGAGEVIAGRLKGHLSDADALQKLSEAGVNPNNYPWLLATAGRPPGIEQMLHLWNRGVATQADVDAAVRQSDINDAFLPFVRELRWYVPPVRSIMAMLRAGARTDAEATALFTENGVRAQDIPAYLAEAHHGRTATVREVSQSQVTRMYSARLIDRPTALARLIALRFTAPDANLLLDFADHARTERLQNALITKIGTLYVAHKIDRPTAITALSGDQVPADAQADLFHVWDLERAAAVHKPTVAQTIGAFRRTQITALQCKNRLLELGVQPMDIGILVADGWPPSKPGDAVKAANEVINA